MEGQIFILVKPLATLIFERLPQYQPLGKLDHWHEYSGDDAGIEETQKDEEAEGLELYIDGGQFGGQEAGQDPAAIKGRDGDKVEDGEHHVDPDAGRQHVG